MEPYLVLFVFHLSDIPLEHVTTEDGSYAHTSKWLVPVVMHMGFVAWIAPPSSQDRNPIEIVWAMLKKRIEYRTRDPSKCI
jgi:transposase